MIKKCMWCNKESDDLIWLYEVHNHQVGEPQVICRKHIIPGEDPCPIKQYRLYKNGKAVRRVWLEGEELKQAVLQRCSWFKDHLNELQRYSWFEDHPCELTR